MHSLTIFWCYTDPLVILGAATFLFSTAVTVTLASLGVVITFEARGIRAFTALLIAPMFYSGEGEGDSGETKDT